MVGTILKEWVKFKNSMKIRNLTCMALVLWQIMATNMLPQVGHPNEIGNFGALEHHHP